MPAVDLVPALQQRRVTILAGAGVSVLPPSCLPTWWALNHAVLDALSAQAEQITDEAAAVIREVKRRQDEGKLPPEFTSEVIAGSMAQEYFEVLRCLEGQRVNAVHRWLAALGPLLPAIITTNFDTLIERAFASAGIPLRVLVRPADYTAIDLEAHLADPASPTLLIKLHGTATRPETCIDTLAQRKRGLPEAVGTLLRGLLRRTRLTVLGYSGADLDAEPNYLYLRQLASEGTPGVTWLYLPEVKAPYAVEEMIYMYGERGCIERGSLPQWLEPLGPALAGSCQSPPAAESYTQEEVEALRRDGRATLQQGALKWGQALGPFAGAFVVADLAVASGTTRAIRIYTALKQWVDQHEPGTRHQGVAWLKLARWMSNHGQAVDAVGLYRQAVALLERLGAVDAVGEALNDYGNLLRHFGQLDDALTLYREAVRLGELAGKVAETVFPLGNIATVMARKGDVAGGLAVIEESMARVLRLGDEPLRATSLEHAACFLRDLGRPDEATARLREAEQVRRRLGQDAELADHLSVQASILITRTEQWPEARRLLAEARTIALRLGRRRTEATILEQSAALEMLAGDYRAAELNLKAALQLREELREPLGALTVLVSLVALYATRSQPDAAIAVGEPALVQARELGTPKIAGDLASNLGIAYEMKLDYERAREHYVTARDTAAKTGDVRVGMLAAANLANLASRQGKLDEAEAAYRDTLERAYAAGDLGVVVRTLANLALILTSRDRHQESAQAYEEALTVAQTHGLLGICAPVCMNYGITLWRLSQFAGAAQMFESTCQLALQLGDPVAAGTGKYYRGVMQLKLGQPADASASLAEALAVWEGHSVPEAAQARELLAKLTAGG
jgi:tetratricopeptide (TPR) repeat protein